jgi:hypothetical protein
MAPRSWSGRSGQEVAQDGSVGTGGGGSGWVGQDGRLKWEARLVCVD